MPVKHFKNSFIIQFSLKRMWVFEAKVIVPECHFAEKAKNHHSRISIKMPMTWVYENNFAPWWVCELSKILSPHFWVVLSQQRVPINDRRRLESHANFSLLEKVSVYRPAFFNNTTKHILLTTTNQQIEFVETMIWTTMTQIMLLGPLQSL